MSGDRVEIQQNQQLLELTLLSGEIAHEYGHRRQVVRVSLRMRQGLTCAPPWQSAPGYGAAPRS